MGSLLSGVLPGVFSFALGVIWQSWRASSSEVAAQLNDLIKDIQQLEDLASGYWASSASDSGNKLLEVKIRGLLFIVAEFEGRAHLLFRKQTDQYLPAIDAFFIACTGGGFETSEREPDFARAILVKETASAVISIARRARQDSAGLTAIYWEVRRYWYGVDSALSSVVDRIIFLVALPFKRLKGFFLPLF